jgi:hypothetical protein
MAASAGALALVPLTEIAFPLPKRGGLFDEGGNREG